jgi:hypothetical protein
MAAACCWHTFVLHCKKLHVTLFAALGSALAVAIDFSPALRSGARWPWQPFTFDIGGA